MLLATLLPGLGIAATPVDESELQRRKLELEVKKLELEVDKLGEGFDWVPVVSGLVGLVLGVGSMAAPRECSSW